MAQKQKVVSMQTRLAAVLVREAAGGRSVPVSVICRELGISRQSYYVYRRRFAAEGVAGLSARSRRPHSSPGRISAEVEDGVVAVCKQLDEQGWDCGAISIRVRLLADAAAGAGGDGQAWPVPSLRSIHRILHRRGLIAAQPHKRTRDSYRRFEFPASNDCWQIDAFEHTLTDGSKVVVFEVLDDHSRFLLANLAWLSEDGAGAWAAVSTAIGRHRRPRMLLSDNSLAFSGARRSRRVQFEANLRVLGVKPITSRPYRPTTCGKNERAHQTCRRWLRRRPSAQTIDELQAQLDTYRDGYNTRRPHQGIGLSTPAARYHAGHRELPAPDGDQHPTRISEHQVSARGQIRLDGIGIGIGSQWAGSKVTAFRGGDHVLIFYRDELVRELTLDHSRNFQPTGQPRGGPRRLRITDTVT
jgi:transposase InsO family protein